MKFKIFIASCCLISLISIVGLLHTNVTKDVDSITNTSNIKTQEAVITPAAEVKPNLEILDAKDDYTSGSTEYITGHVKNNTTNNYDSVYISFGLYNDKGDKVGDAIDIISGLDSLGTWEFKAITNIKFANYKVSDIHGY